MKQNVNFNKADFASRFINYICKKYTAWNIKIKVQNILCSDKPKIFFFFTKTKYFLQTKKPPGLQIAGSFILWECAIVVKEHPQIICTKANLNWRVW